MPNIQSIIQLDFSVDLIHVWGVPSILHVGLVYCRVERQREDRSDHEPVYRMGHTARRFYGFWS